MSQPRISFIVAVRNCLELTQATLRSLEATVDLAGHELIIVDDASDSETERFLNSLADRFVVLRNDRNLGFAKSNNRAAQRATGDYLLLINNDLEFLPGWLEPMLEMSQTLPKVGAIGNIQMNYRTGLVDHAGIFFNLEGMPTHAWKTRGRIPKGDWKERNAATAACLLIKRSVFEKMNGFDEGYENGMEDVDLCVRLRQEGFRIYVSHKSVIRHHISSSPGRHIHNDANSNRFRTLHSRNMIEAGRREWPREYLHRYGRYWWRMEPTLFFKALTMLLFKRR